MNVTCFFVCIVYSSILVSMFFSIPPDDLGENQDD